jgi:sugar phosphate isomerase/epimerase
VTAPDPVLRELSVSLYAAPVDCSLERFCRLLADRGIGGVGLTVRATQDRTPEQVAALLAAHDLVGTSLNSAGYFLHADEGRARAQRELDTRLLDWASVLQVPLNVIPGGVDDARATGERVTLGEVRRRAQAALEELAARAATLGVRVSLEPMHPLELPDKGCINQLSAARAAVAELPGVGLTLDLFHSWWDADLTDTIASAVDDLLVVQVCGVVTGPAGTLPRRTGMALGSVDVSELLNKLDAAGRTAPVEFEVMQFQQAQEVTGLLDRAARDWVQLRSHSSR